MTPQKTAAQVITRLRSYANPANLAGMARYGINTAAQPSPSARWTAGDVLRELRARAAFQ